MKIVEHEITIRELVDGYVDNQEQGVYGYHGLLNIRPPYQRELVYDLDKQREVIKSVRNNFPLNVMYFMENDDGTYELLDGQQRTLSICRYWDNQYSLNFDGQPKKFHNLGTEAQQDFLKYPIKVYFCKGNVDERKKWFEIINFKGEALTTQELLNAIYCGPWVTDAKRYFSKTGCVAYELANAYLNNKSAIRQQIFETALKWIADKNEEDYEEYMATHQNDSNAEELWKYFKDVIEWVERTFGCPDNYRSPMKKVEWGIVYNKYHEKEYDSEIMEEKISNLFNDYEITREQGIYEFVFDGDPKHLNLRKFDEKTKKIAYKQQSGICPICNEHFKYEEMEGDHWKPWSKGGATTQENCKMLCCLCNQRKKAKEFADIKLKSYV